MYRDDGDIVSSHPIDGGRGGVLEATAGLESDVGEYLTHRVRRYVEAAELGKRGSCHLFRHAMATLMLEHGADVRYVQEMLGQANLGTTQIYTHVSIRRLKEIHSATHPGARLQRRRPRARRRRLPRGARPRRSIFPWLPKPLRKTTTSVREQLVGRRCRRRSTDPAL